MTDIDRLAQELAEGLLEYSAEVTEKIKKTVDNTADEAVKELKSTSPVLTKSYAKGWRKTKAYEDSRSKRNTVHNKTDHQLTHLLEKGHASRNGGRVAPVKHIEPVEEKVISTFEEKIRQVLAE